jgi:FPC/CPF motif-containing protein YcgG
LINYTASSRLTFIRNGSEHTSVEAADLMRKKFAFVKKEVKTPEDFIRLAASESHLTGKPYLVKLPDGKSVPSAEWLSEALRKYRAAHAE